MKKILSIILGMLCIFSCTLEPNLEKVKSSIVETEIADIPLHIQKFDGVFDIQIDTIVFTNNIQPYVGYLVTTWDINEKQDLSHNEWASNGYKDKYIRKTKTVYVPVTDVTINSGRNASISWRSNWISAYYDIIIKHK